MDLGEAGAEVGVGGLTLPSDVGEDLSLWLSTANQRYKDLKIDYDALMEKYQASRSLQLMTVDLYHKERVSALNEQEVKFSKTIAGREELCLQTKSRPRQSSF